ncbi:MFS transporter small subunit [Streptomyces axinellae]|uniref:Uncharacterized protein n=1 Tax=Streptomyces axinellae TaxID=552788 RepID=A0ABP6CUZ4_9ACTN
MTPSNGVPPESTTPPTTASPARTPLAVLAWLWVGLPLVYGLYELISKATQLFTD